MKLLKGLGFYLLIIIACIFTFGIFAFFTSIIPSKLLAPKDYIFWTVNPIFMYVVFLFEGLLLLTFIPLSQGLKKKNKDTAYAKFPIFLKKHLVAIIIGVITLIYIASTNVTVVTPNKIIYHSSFNPKGTVYSYNDIIGVDTGFYGKKQFLANYKGDFYYFIRLKDGTRIDLNRSGGVNPNIEGDDTYKTIEDLDKKIMESGATKISSKDYSQYCYYDKQYKDRFIRIIENK